MITNEHLVSGKTLSFRQDMALQIGDMLQQFNCLVLFGGGRFHFLALNEYLRNHPKESDQCISQVFVDDRFKVHNNKIVNFKQRDLHLVAGKCLQT